MFKNSVDERQNSLADSFSEKLQQVVLRFSSANQKTQTELKNSDDKLSKFEDSVEERQNSLEESFSEKVQQSDDKISLLSADTQKQLSEIALDFASKSSSLETEMLDKLEYISFHLKKVEEQIENQVSDLSTSLKKFVVSITTSQEEKIDAQEQKIQKSIKSLKQELFEFQRDLKTDFDKNIKERELKTNDYLSKRIFEVRELLSGEVVSLSGELTILNDVVKEKHSQLAAHVDNNVSSIKATVEKDRRYFNNQFKKVSDNIQSLESMIVKEEDLVELFQNYTLNVNITDSIKPSKK
jgi:hypothetical protein